MKFLQVMGVVTLRRQIEEIDQRFFGSCQETLFLSCYFHFQKTVEELMFYMAELESAHSGIQEFRPSCGDTGCYRHKFRDDAVI